MSTRGFPITAARRAERRVQAEKRQAEYDKLSLQEKLDRLPPEPAAQRQRTKLLDQVKKSEEKVKQDEAAKSTVSEKKNKKENEKGKNK